MFTMRMHLLVVLLLAVVVINGHPYEQANEEQPLTNDLENDQATHYSLKNKRYEVKGHNRRHKRYFRNHMEFQPPNSDYNSAGQGFYPPPPPMLGYCPPWPPQKPAEACPEKEILKELIKVMQNPPSIRVTCGPAAKVNATITNPNNVGPRFGDDKPMEVEKERNWGMVDDYAEMTPEEAVQYERREIDLNPYSPEVSASKVSRKHCDFVYTACCFDEETIESCYKKNGCEKNFREGNACVEKTKDELHKYIASTFKYRNGQ